MSRLWISSAVFSLLLHFPLATPFSGPALVAYPGMEVADELFFRQKVKPFKLSKEEKKEGFEILFEGTTMSEWMGNTEEYVLEDGCIVMKPVQQGGGNLYTKGKFDDFVFRFEFMLTAGANNGLGIRHNMVAADKGYEGMELQILDNEDPQYKDLKPYQYHGSVYGYIPAKRGHLKPVGEWNVQEVMAEGDHIKITLNGTVIVDGNIREATKDVAKDKIQPAFFNKEGHIAFLGHGSELRFRHIRIKEL